MLCQKCKREATVHMREAIDGVVREVYLCLECAQDQGVVVPKTPGGLPLESVLQKFVTAHLGELVGELARRRCPCCRMSYMEFRANGRLGCPNDYTTFESGLLPMIKQSHSATRHVGKRPQRHCKNGPELIRLRTALGHAIDDQNYEEAAQLRDAIRDALKDALS